MDSSSPGFRGRSTRTHHNRVNLPNFISLARLLSTPVVVWLMLTGAMGLAFWLFALAALSDAVDGYIARRTHGETVLGAYLDVLADKVLLASVYVVLGALGYLPLWLVMLVVFRDLLIVGGVLLLRLLALPFKMRPLMVSKVNTVAQIMLGLAVLARLGFDLTVEDAEVVLIYGAAVTALASGAIYIVEWMRVVGRTEVNQ